MITGGDMADAADCRAARRAAPAARLLNAYGLTETTITSALADLSAPPEAGPVPVGRATRHVRIMILDENLDPAPAGTTGEIYIGGRGVARGYLGWPALTAERFLPDPRGAGSRMYRTGDLGRWRADGQLEVSGRADRQLKVRGFRIEPGEIESALAAHPDIGQVAVAATGQGPGDQRLTAYYTLRRPEAPPPGTADMRGFLRARLPGHMIPAAFIPLDQMPPAPAGAPALSTPGHPKVTAPAVVPGAVPGERRTPTQAGMTYLWSKLLKKDQVSLDDDFFALGGNSLLAAEMLARTRVMFGIGADFVRPLTRCLLRDPTLRGFAQATQDARAGRLATDGDQGQIDFAREAELAPSGCGRTRGARGRTGAGRWRPCSPGRPDSSGRTCSASCWPAPPRGSGAWSGRATPRTAGSVSPTPPPGTTSATCLATAWCRCPVTWPRPGWACPPANSVSLPGAPTSSITRARS
jgi:hypothetical protein